MNCEECKEQVLELIDREAVDPEGVRELLVRCPDCKAAFEEMKRTLALAEELPLEEPPASLDAPILRAARARASQVVPLKKRRLQPPPWAMAAIAILAVGVGVWTIPGEVRFEGEGDSPVQAPAAEALPRQQYADHKSVAEEAPHEPALADDEDTFAGRAAVAEAPATTPAPAPAAKRAEPVRRKAATKRWQAPRRSASSSGDLAAAGAAPAPSVDARAAGAEESEADAPARAETASTAEKKELTADSAAATVCRRRVDEVERRVRADEDYTPSPEEELAIGRCYLELDQTHKARTWLRRAAEHGETRARAESALRSLADD